GPRGGIFTAWMPAPARSASKDGELPGEITHTGGRLLTLPGPRLAAKERKEARDVDRIVRSAKLSASARQHVPRRPEVTPSRSREERWNSPLPATMPSTTACCLCTAGACRS